MIAEKLQDILLKGNYNFFTVICSINKAKQFCIQTTEQEYTCVYTFDKDGNFVSMYMNCTDYDVKLEESCLNNIYCGQYIDIRVYSGDKRIPFRNED